MDALAYIIGVLILGVVFGLITDHINKQKGYDSGFWWGFWLGWIGIIVVAVRAPLEPKITYSSEKISEGYWRCNICGERNSPYFSVCKCGTPKEKAILPQTPPPAQEVSSISKADELLKYKQLLDAGVITEDDFNKKKKELLGV